MKKLMSLLLAVVMLTSVMAGCSSEDEEESKGAIIPVYLSTEITNFDPIYAYTDVAAAKVLNLIFDGLTTINEKGEVELELAKSIKIVENPDEVVVTERVDGGTVYLELSVAESDMGKVIGKQGRIAKSIRTVMKVAAIRENKRVIVDIV